MKTKIEAQEMSFAEIKKIIPKYIKMYQGWNLRTPAYSMYFGSEKRSGLLKKLNLYKDGIFTVDIHNRIIVCNHK